MCILKGGGLIRGWRLFGTRRLLEKIRYALMASFDTSMFFVYEPKWFLVQGQLESFKLQISHLLRARSSLRLRQL